MAQTLNHLTQTTITFKSPLQFYNFRLLAIEKGVNFMSEWQGRKCICLIDLKKFNSLNLIKGKNYA